MAALARRYRDENLEKEALLRGVLLLNDFKMLRFLPV
jgi:hypothetical protein